VPPDIAARVHGLSREVGLPAADLQRRPADVSAATRMRAHVARAIALDPAIVLMEHPTVSLPREAIVPFAQDVARMAQRRALTLVAITEDATFAARVAGRHLRLKGASGELAPVKRFYFF
jgi:ABC-type transporter Mla maintaining outer membrane lipid asymmetry ATPase subunit MlaF